MSIPQKEFPLQKERKTRWMQARILKDGKDRKKKGGGQNGQKWSQIEIRANLASKGTRGEKSPWGWHGSIRKKEAAEYRGLLRGVGTQ